MPLGQMQQGRWRVALEVLKYAARIPVALFLIFATGCLAWVLVWFVFRLTQYIYMKFLYEAWI